MKKLFATVAFAALALAVVPASAQGVIPYIPSIHHGYDAPAPVQAYGKASVKKHHRHHRGEASVDTRPRAQAVIPFAPMWLSIHEWEDQDYRGAFQSGAGN